MPNSNRDESDADFAKWMYHSESPALLHSMHTWTKACEVLGKHDRPPPHLPHRRGADASRPFLKESNHARAFGCGHNFALGALKVGASPKEAVLAAAHFNMATDHHLIERSFEYGGDYVTSKEMLLQGSKTTTSRNPN